MHGEVQTSPHTWEIGSWSVKAGPCAGVGRTARMLPTRQSRASGGGRGEDMKWQSCGQQTCPKLGQRVSPGGAGGALTHLPQVLAPACSAQPCEKMWQMRADVGCRKSQS